MSITNLEENEPEAETPATGTPEDEPQVANEGAESDSDEENEDEKSEDSEDKEETEDSEEETL